MCDEVLDRIVKCAHFKKIATVEDLKKETQWPRATELGQSVVELVLAHCPIPAPEPLTVVKTAVRTCSQCGGTGHIRDSSRCGGSYVAHSYCMYVGTNAK